MIKSLANITGFFKVIAIALAIMTVMLQPTSAILFSQNNSDLEISEIDYEEDSEEKEEHTEEDNTNENFELQRLASVNSTEQIIRKNINYQFQTIAQNFSLEIPIPPPEQV